MVSYTITAEQWFKLHGVDTLEEYLALPSYPLAQFCKRCNRLKKSVGGKCSHCRPGGANE